MSWRTVVVGVHGRWRQHTTDLSRQRHLFPHAHACRVCLCWHRTDRRPLRGRATRHTAHGLAIGTCDCANGGVLIVVMRMIAHRTSLSELIFPVVSRDVAVERLPLALREPT